MIPAHLSEAIAPESVPKRALYTGALMPAIGLGTFGSDRVAPETIAEAVKGAGAVGYRHFDCAAAYGNEHVIGPALHDVMKAGVRRNELWVTSKLWNDRHGDVISACRKSLADLQLEYLDLYLVHWPFPNYHLPGCDVRSRSQDGRPYIHDGFMKTWRQMEELVGLGMVRHIGTSNMTIPKLKLLLRDCRIRPAANEMELHPYFRQPELFNFVRSEGIEPIGYCPLGSPGRPERDRTPDDTADLEDPIIARIATRHGVHPAAVCLKWAVQRGQTPIPMSTRRANYVANLRAVVEGPLGNDEMRAIEGIEQQCRLIKGQVFLWKEGQNWEDLWDLNGEITPA